MSIGGDLLAAMGTTSRCSAWVSTTMKSSKSPRESGAKRTVYLQLIPGATTPPSPGNLPAKTYLTLILFIDLCAIYLLIIWHSRWCWCSLTASQECHKTPIAFQRCYEFIAKTLWHSSLIQSPTFDTLDDFLTTNRSRYKEAPIRAKGSAHPGQWRSKKW